jgi:predicted nucleic acid-binding Zn finger protein
VERVKVDYRSVVEALSIIRIDCDPVELWRLHGYRFSRAWENLKEDRVKKYVFRPSGRVVWVVVGRDREYLIYHVVGYCSCDDFYFSVIDGKVSLCHHLIARKLAEVLGRFEVVEQEDELYSSHLEEWTSVETRREEVLL